MKNPSYTEISGLAAGIYLEILGGFHPRAEDHLPDDLKTLLLLGPREPGFWAKVSSATEFGDCTSDPLDRWSERVLSDLARQVGGTALFPFGGPPYQPFIQWAIRTGRSWQSPATLLVHDQAGLMVSYRGALALPWRVELPATGPSPCLSCADKPCLSACPAKAITSMGYDLPKCHRFLDTAPGRDCMVNGCKVRRACPVSARSGRLAKQSAFHMKAFHP